MNSPSECRDSLGTGVKPYYSEDGITIFCADCRDILPSLPKVDLVLTDPPYGISHSSGYGASWQNTEIVGDDSTDDRDWLITSLPETPMFVFGTWKSPRPARTRQVLIFDKGPAFGMGDLSFPWKNSFEEIYVLGNGFTGSRDESVVKGHIQVSWESQGRCHPNQKPLSLMVYLIGKHPAEMILDPFMGSGTTLVAAKQLGRRAIGIEIEEKYCAIAVDRLRQSVLDFEPPRPATDEQMALLGWQDALKEEAVSHDSSSELPEGTDGEFTGLSEKESGEFPIDDILE
jgi:hypothetical protein